jgi:acetyl esterase
VDRSSLSDEALHLGTRALIGATRRLRGAPLQRNDRGEELDGHAAALIQVAERIPRLSAQPTGRARLASDTNSRLVDVPFVAVPRVSDRMIAGPYGDIAIRVYVPLDGPRALPMLVYFHGGGFVIGSLASHDRVLRRLCKHAGVIVVAVDYRLAPEHRFPAAVDDCLAATRWAIANASSLGADGARVAIGGDSAGGSLAATICLAMRVAKDAQRARMQMLVYPATDLRRISESHRTLGHGYLLTSELISWFMDRYLRSKADELDWRGSPLLATHHGDLPPAWITVAGFDPLRDEGEQYAAKLREAGVRVEMQYESSLIHGFFTMGGVIPRAVEVVDTAARALVAGLSG